MISGADDRQAVDIGDWNGIEDKQKHVLTWHFCPIALLFLVLQMYIFAVRY